MMKSWGLLIASLSMTAAAHGLSFSGPSTWVVAPQTFALGTPTNNLSLVDFATGFSVNGQYLVNVIAGVHSGVLLEYEAERPIDPTSPSGFEVVTSNYVGFVDAPAGALAGSMIGNSYVFNYQFSNTPINFAYPGPGTWTFNVTNTNTILFAMGGGQFLRQRTVVQYSYSSTNNGQYIVDLPAISSVQPVPEPATIMVMGLGMATLLRRRRKA